MGTFLDNKEIGFDCPKCGHKIKKTIGWLKANDKVVCAGCGSEIGLDTKKLTAGTESAQKTIDAFKKRR